MDVCNFIMSDHVILAKTYQELNNTCYHCFAKIDQNFHLCYVNFKVM